LEKEKLTDTGFLVFFRIGFKKLTGRVFRILDRIDAIDQSTSDANIQWPGTPDNRDFALIFGYGNYLRIRRSTKMTHRGFTYRGGKWGRMTDERQYSAKSPDLRDPG
jgi:hypothetical protein